MKTFKNKVAVITGGASGMGRATALALAREGVHVAIADLNEERMAKTVGELKALGVRALSVRCDVSRPEDISNLCEQTVKDLERVDILMNNAGILPIGRFENTSLSEWEHTIRVNFLSVVSGVQIFLPHLEASGDGHVVNTASMAATFAYEPGTLAYNASKAAVLSLTEGLALALAPKQIGVTCLIPGPVSTNIMEQARRSGPIGPLTSYVAANFKLRTAEEVGAMVVEAIRNNRFFLPTNENLNDVLRRRARDPNGFLREMQVFLATPAPPSSAN